MVMGLLVDGVWQQDSAGEQPMIAAAPIVLEATAEGSGDAGELPDGDVEDSA
jgi:hypothetical protein